MKATLSWFSLSIYSYFCFYIILNEYVTSLTNLMCLRVCVCICEIRLIHLFSVSLSLVFILLRRLIIFSLLCSLLSPTLQHDCHILSFFVMIFIYKKVHYLTLFYVLLNLIKFSSFRPLFSLKYLSSPSFFSFCFLLCDVSLCISQLRTTTSLSHIIIYNNKHFL